LHKSTEIQDEVKALKKEMGTLAIEFCRNLNEESSVLEFTEKELGEHINNWDKECRTISGLTFFLSGISRHN